MWGVNHTIFGIIRNAMSYNITRWNVTIFWRADFVLYHFKSKSCFFIDIYFHQTQSVNKTDQIISYNMYTVAMDTTTKLKKSKNFKGLLDSTTRRRRNNFRITICLDQIQMSNWFIGGWSQIWWNVNWLFSDIIIYHFLVIWDAIARIMTSL